jgi:hypothetical protein
MPDTKKYALSSFIEKIWLKLKYMGSNLKKKLWKN